METFRHGLETYRLTVESGKDFIHRPPPQKILDPEKLQQYIHNLLSDGTQRDIEFALDTVVSAHIMSEDALKEILNHVQQREPITTERYRHNIYIYSKKIPIKSIKES